MSTAVMQTSALYDFGDLLYKNHNNANLNNSATSTSNHRAGSGSASSSGSTAATVSASINMNANMQHKVLRWGQDAAARAVGGPTPLSRRSSNPGTASSASSAAAAAAAASASATIAVTASLVSSVSSILIDNMRGDAGSASNSVSLGSPHRKLDRSQSEPASCSKNSPGSGLSRYKTELCRPYEESGSCKYGDKCQFAHGAKELRSLVRHPKYKTELCRTFHSTGFCPYGPRCHFIHNSDEARNKPKPLDLGGSTAESPNSSLSQSPTNSVGSFFTDGDVFTSMSPTPAGPTAFSFGQEFSPLVPIPVKNPAPGSPVPSLPGSQGSGSPRGSPPPLGGESTPRLPVFNRLSSSVHVGLGLLGTPREQLLA